jgi:hypothetical protein
MPAVNRILPLQMPDQPLAKEHRAALFEEKDPSIRTTYRQM